MSLLHILTRGTKRLTLRARIKHKGYEVMTDNPKTLILIRGLSSSGKTTLADIICGDDDSRIAISADDYFYDDNDVYTFNSENLKDAHAWCKRETATCMAQGFSLIVVHNTFTRGWEVEPYLELAARRGYRVIVSSLFDAGQSDTDLAVRSKHNVRSHHIRAQRARWQSDVFRPPQRHR